MLKRVVLCLVVLLALVKCAKYPIEHVVVLLEENRSFDHMCGYMNKINPKINGLRGNETNPIDIHKKDSPLVHVNNKSPYIAPFDPDHSMEGTSIGIFGEKNGWNKKPTMKGFVYANHERHPKHPQNTMGMFNPEKVPIITTLIKEFALIDAFHSSVPGPTCPNRYFAESASSGGMIDNRHVVLEQDTIYDRVKEVGKTWKIYYSDFVFCSLNFAHLNTKESKANIYHINQFYQDAKDGKLAHYTFIHPQGAPKGNTPANDQHPDHTVLAGEKFMKEVYEAIRASPQWNKTLFVLTYDEHGGFYDHVHPPMKDVPNPDGKHGSNGFKFDMLGVRIPAILISPWINKGIVEHQAKGPHPSSHYDLSSIPATVKKIFGWEKFLTKRDAWAGTFDHLLLQRTIPRTDCPMHLPPVPKFEDENYVEIEKQKPVNDLQMVSLRSLEQALKVTEKESFENQEEYSNYIEKLMEQFLSQ